MHDEETNTQWVKRMERLIRQLQQLQHRHVCTQDVSASLVNVTSKYYYVCMNISTMGNIAVNWHIHLRQFEYDDLFKLMLSGCIDHALHAIFYECFAEELLQYRVSR